MKYLLFTLLPFLCGCSCQAQQNKTAGKQAEPGLIDIKAVKMPDGTYYTVLMRNPESVVKSKYFSPEKAKDVKSQYETWGTKNTVFAYSSGLNDTHPLSFQIINGTVANKAFAPPGMDALVVIPPTEKIAVYNLADPTIKFKIAGLDPTKSFALRNEDPEDKEDFINWARKARATVFQTYLLVYKNKIIPQKFTTPEKSIRRYLIDATDGNNGGEEVYLIVQTASPYTADDGLRRTIEMVKYTYSGTLTINYLISLTAPSVKNAFRVNKSDGSPYNEFKNTIDLEDINGLLVFYGNGKINFGPSPGTSPGPGNNPGPNVPDSPKPVVDITDLQALTNEYTRLETQPDGSQDTDSIDSPDKERLNKNLVNLIRNTSGSKMVKFNGVSYSIFIADLDKTEINLNLKDPKSNKNFSSITNVKHRLEDSGMKPLMITNAGMFTPAHDPQGLYVDKISEHKYPLDTRDGLPGNFYLKPNGVFYIDEKNKPHIRLTEEVDIMIGAKAFTPKIATQSGPILVIDNKIHPLFTKGSNNVNIRSGVGVFSENKVIFAISNTPTNFYDFAVLFRNILNCKNALYLDGAISQMYLSDLNPNIPDGSFGPILSISTKK